MSDDIPERLGNEAVNPAGFDHFDVQGHLIEQLICLGTAHLPTPPCHRDERYVAGEQQIGLGNCAVCLNAPNNCFLVFYAQGLSSCGHLICSMCAVKIVTKGDRTCPFCRQPIHWYELVDFP